MDIQVGQAFTVRVTDPRYSDYRTLTQGSHAKGADINKGIWAYQAINGPDRDRRPAVLLHSNRLDASTESNPWVDVIEADRGYAIYHGDNRQVGKDPFSARGNKLLMELQDMYTDPTDRAAAPPILLFDQVEVDGKRKGYRQFAGYGVPTRYTLLTQAAKAGGYFT